MKKIFIFITLISIFVLTGCKKGGYIRLSFDDLQLKLNDKDTFVLVIGSDTCSACAKYKTTMESVIKENKLDIYYLDLDSLTEEEYSKIYSKYVITSTPTTIFIKDGLETSTYDRIAGAAGYSDIIENLKKHGYIGD
ncbi:MAG: thioredoxin family protein [Firmicutes bacterium]|nr:thioredoxin family protein [Bacillota bacterium]